MSSFQIVLGIPIPRCVQALPRFPPACLPSQGDISAIELLRVFGIGLGINKHEITQACNLASGFSDVIIILERPYAKNYDTSFETFVQGCKSLQAVDDLIRFATKGARSIHTVTILDAFSYQPNRNVRDFDRKCHQLLHQILSVKKPTVVIRCHRDTYQDEWMRRFELPGEGYRLMREDVDFGDGHRAILIQSFHPSCAVNNAECRPEYRALLIHHFVAAFAELHGQYQLPEYVEDIRKLCLKKGQRVQKDIPKLKSWEAANFIAEALKTGYNGPETWRPVEFADDEPSNRFENRKSYFSDMNHGLQRLAGKFCTCGALSIAKIILFYWKQHFKDDPLYIPVKSLLFLRGSEQRGWLCPCAATNDTPTTMLLSLEERFSQLSVSSPPQTLQTLCKELAPFCETGLPEDVAPSKFTELVRLVAGLVRQWDVFIEIMTNNGHVLDMGKAEARKDLAYCLTHLGMLEAALQGCQSLQGFGRNT